MLKESFISNPNVYILKHEFHMPQLNRHRRIWLYMPPGYKESDKRYPVLYMQDGQNLFDEAVAFGEEWGVDDTIDNMRHKCIIVGIDNGKEKRGNEYTIHDTEEFGEAEGKQYLDFIVHTLKPYIDKKFPTIADRDHTVIAGSSMGGLISFYGAVLFPEVFGMAGVFSPAFWIAPQSMDVMKKYSGANSKRPQHFYFYAGGQEGENVVENMVGMAMEMKKFPIYTIEFEVTNEADHSEMAWRNHYPHFYEWMMKNLMKKNRIDKEYILYKA